MRTTTYPIVLLAGILAACSAKAPAPTEESKATTDVISTSMKMSSQLPLVVAETEPTTISTLLSGRVDFDPNAVTHVYPLVSGVVSHIYVMQGDRVAKGQVLADVYSSEFASAVSDFQKARAALTLAKKGHAREQELLASKVASQHDVQQAENEEAQAKADFDRSLEALKLLGGNERSTNMTFQITAPIAGTVVERTVQPGSQMRSDGSSLAFTIGSTQSIWITLDAYPENLRMLHVGDSVVLKAAGLEDHPFISHIEYISPTVDPTTFTTKVRCTLPNSGGLLKPAMFVGATAYHPDGPGLFIPAAAAFYDSDGKVYVFVKAGMRAFRKRQIHAGQVQPDRIQVVDGLNAGDTVVADNALFLNDELQADQK
ncbi:MAG: efflux RND transporter periplasmic adaptor subunit [Bacteroidota bacterium]|nr:efflux RND transporter periplasmic adaptor subunit [Bacteroidota bacterium]MDP4231952.1 efflux RND transporter periplasmic adaptor subunit [Bacteroidota bacterium]MDP4241341.1 efflux RND transporter periplasmic adaptor subunit [Bacteroidota bacterium]MDP4287262.1 efflux RND transporter periplasmic adaptor subunit [Bacteroidota bacterium]